MKKLLLFLILISSTVFAQRADLREKMQEVKSMKIAHITSELSLTSDEAAKFWPVYNAFEARERELRRERMAITRSTSRVQSEPMNEKDASAALAQLEQNEEELYRERKKFTAQLKQILPSSKILKLTAAEEDFSRRLLRQYKKAGKKR